MIPFLLILLLIRFLFSDEGYEVHRIMIKSKIMIKRLLGSL